MLNHTKYNATLGVLNWFIQWPEIDSNLSFLVDWRNLILKKASKNFLPKNCIISLLERRKLKPFPFWKVGPFAREKCNPLCHRRFSRFLTIELISHTLFQKDKCEIKFKNFLFICYQARKRQIEWKQHYIWISKNNWHLL